MAIGNKSRVRDDRLIGGVQTHESITYKIGRLILENKVHPLSWYIMLGIGPLPPWGSANKKRPPEALITEITRLGETQVIFIGKRFYCRSLSGLMPAKCKSL